MQIVLSALGFEILFSEIKPQVNGISFAMPKLKNNICKIPLPTSVSIISILVTQDNPHLLWKLFF